MKSNIGRNKYNIYNTKWPYWWRERLTRKQKMELATLLR